jgi:hypothetical protein
MIYHPINYACIFTQYLEGLETPEPWIKCVYHNTIVLVKHAVNIRAYYNVPNGIYNQLIVPM